MSADSAPDEALLEAVALAGLDTLDGAFAYGGGQDITKAGLGRRRRTRLVLPDGRGQCHSLYLKRYGREPLAGWLRRLVTYGPGRSPARTEFENIRAARAAGVATMQAVIFGDDSPWAWRRRSYIIVAPVPGDALERCFERFLAMNPSREAAEDFTRKLAKMVSTLHGAGYVHRDLYSSHVFLCAAGGPAKLYLIDLARMFRPRWRWFRWVVKDLAQLKYSMPAAWGDRWWDFFLAEYLGPQHEAHAARYNRAIDGKVRRMLRHIRRKGRRRPAGTPEQ